MKVRGWKGNKKTIFGEWKGKSILTEKDLYSSDKFDKFEQVTPYCDNNGKEIYEGDILVTKDMERGDVFLNDYDWAIDCGDDVYISLRSIASGSIIVGNITENPELIK